MATTIRSETAVIDYDEYAGDTLPINLGYADETGALIDLTGSTVLFELRANKEDAAALLSLSSADNEIDTTATTQTINGQTVSFNIKLAISAAQTTALGIGKFSYFIKVTDSLGAVNTLVVGTIKLRQR